MRQIEKGAGAEARKPLTRPADAELSSRHLLVDPASFRTPSKLPVPGAAPGVRCALPLYRRLGSLVPNKPVWLSRQESHLHGRVQSAVAYC